MRIERIPSKGLYTNCYIVNDDYESIIIDPGADEGEILRMLTDIPSKVLYIVLTHGHFDHISSAEEIKRQTGAQILIHEADAPMLTDNDLNKAVDFGFSLKNIYYDRLIAEGDIIKVGSKSFEVLHTPGHSEGCICLYGEGMLFCGDTLFKGTIGNFERENKETMRASLKRLLALPKETKVYPGHYLDTTIGQELTDNPFAAFDWEWE